MKNNERVLLRTRLFYFVLYFCEGAPIGLIWWALPAELRSHDWSVEKISTLTASLALPWTFKFLWAPMIDRFRGEHWGFRAWLLLAQTGMILSLLPLAFLPLGENYFSVIWATLLVHAFFAATQDVSIDGWALSEVREDERAQVNAFMQMGMLTGRWLFGAGFLILGSGLSRQSAVLALAFTLFLVSFLVFFRKTSAPDRREALPDETPRFRKVLATLVRSPILWAAMIFALSGGAAFEAFGALAGPFLLDAGLEKERIGWFYTLSILAMAIGSWCGGKLADRWGHLRSSIMALFSVTGLVLIMAAPFWMETHLSPGFLANYAFVTGMLVYFGVGLLTVSSYALFMDLSAGAFAATRFSAFMGMTNACESWSAFLGGRLSGIYGYGPAFSIVSFLSIVLAFPALLFLSLRRRARTAKD